MEFSEVVKYVREKLELSQEDLAREHNVSFATVARIQIMMVTVSVING